MAMMVEQPKRDDIPRWERWQGAKISQHLMAHGILLAYTVLAVAPVLLLFINTFKTRKAIFANPYAIALPGDETFSLEGFETVFANSHFPQYFLNSLIVVLASLFFIMWFGSMAAFALSEYKFKGNTLMGLYMSVGIM